jgi:hypothetical protein
MITYTIETGDLVHARFYTPNRDNVATQDFYITEIDGTVYQGGAISCDTAAGWELELRWKSLENLNLPSGLSEITVLLYDGTEVHAYGKGTSWTRETGEPLSTDQIFAWSEGYI